MEQAFNIGTAISFAWTKVKEQLGFFIGFALLIIIIQFINGFMQNIFENSEALFLVIPISIIISFLIGLIIGLFQIRISLDVADGKKASFESIKQVLPLFGKAFITHILYSVIMLIGFLLFVIPGFIWAIKYQYALYFVIDKNISPFEALEASGKVTQGEKWHLFLFNLVLGLVMFAGVLAFGVGVLIALPVAMIAPAYVFRKLQKHVAVSGNPTKTPATPQPAL